MQKLKALFFIVLATAVVLSASSRLPLSTASPTAGHEALLFSSQLHQDLQDVFIKAINEADSTITLLIYTLKDRKVIKTLNKQAKNGIRIEIVCDAEASSKLTSKLNPAIKVTPRLSRGLMHNKILVIDSEKIWLGSANFTSESLRVHANLVFATLHPEMAAMIEEKARSLKPTKRSYFIPMEKFALFNQSAELWFLPDNKNASLRIKELIRSAKKSIRIAMFTWTRLDFAEEIIKAQKRNVSVEVIIDRHSAAGASAKVVKMLQEAKVPLYTNTSQGLLHHKLLFIDDETLEFGSANWTRAAFNDNDDCFIVLAPLNQTQKSQLNKLWKRLYLNSKVN